MGSYLCSRHPRRLPCPHLHSPSTTNVFAALASPGQLVRPSCMWNAWLSTIAVLYFAIWLFACLLKTTIAGRSGIMQIGTKCFKLISINLLVTLIPSKPIKTFDEVFATKVLATSWSSFQLRKRGYYCFKYTHTQTKKSDLSPWESCKWTAIPIAILHSLLHHLCNC